MNTVIGLVYLVFVLASCAVFRWLRPAVAVLVVYLGGWLLLPVGNYLPSAAADEFPYWIIGLALPSDLLLAKSWVAPVAALLGVMLFDRRALLGWRPAWLDAPVALWCLWPLLQAGVVEQTHSAAPADPAGWISSLYLVGSWGLSWFLGRLYFTSPDGRLLLLKGLAWSGLACLPFSVFEGVFGPNLYALAFEPHPFRLDGAVRYIGFRPIGFFEHGNQFGLWISMCALAAVWLGLAGAKTHEAETCEAEIHGAKAHRAKAHERDSTWRYRALAGVVLLMAVAAQSVGAILLLGIGIAFLAACRFVRPRNLLVGASSLLILSGAVYVSGVVPVTRIGKETALGRQVVDSFKAVGRGSFTWRLGQDQKLLPLAMAEPLTGSGRWDWWRAQNARPWGLTLLVLGQFGLVGLGLSLATLLLPALRASWHAPPVSGWSPQAAPIVLAAIVALTVLDGLMNSFIFFPALIAAGGLASMPARRVTASAQRRAFGAGALDAASRLA